MYVEFVLMKNQLIDSHCLSQSQEHVPALSMEIPTSVAILTHPQIGCGEEARATCISIKCPGPRSYCSRSLNYVMKTGVRRCSGAQVIKAL